MDWNNRFLACCTLLAASLSLKALASCSSDCEVIPGLRQFSYAGMVFSRSQGVMI